MTKWTVKTVPGWLHRVRPSLIAWGCVGLSACGGGGSAASAAVAADLPTPAAVISLDHVTLTLPEKADGSLGGTPARTLSSSALLPSTTQPRGYESAYLQTVDTGAGAAVMLWCPVNGALSSASSDSPRTEFRHQVSTGSNDAWTLESGSPVAMQTEFSLQQLPPQRSSLIVAQIHGHKMLDASGQSVSAPPLLLVYAEALDAAKATPSARYQLRAKLRSSPDSVQYVYTSTVLTRFAQLSDWQSLSLSVKGGQLWINGQAFAVDPRWLGVGLYFKAGIYLDEVGTDPSQGGRLWLRTLRFVTP